MMPDPDPLDVAAWPDYPLVQGALEAVEAHRAGRSLRRFTLRFVFVLGVVTGLLLGAAVARL